MSEHHEDATGEVRGDPLTYQVVARRYRPRSFDELVGQAAVAQALRNAIVSNRVGHAYLFTGARGVGKTSTARIFAKALNCIAGPTVHPDNSCDICRSIDLGEDMDVVEIDAASNRGIEEIRQLRATIHIRPARGRYKIYIIDEVHMLTLPAFNALLKTLEEPPEHVKFIFCTTDPEKIPITVLSRCQRFDFAPIDSGQIVERLRYIVAREQRRVDDVVLEELARRAKGSMRDSQSLLEQLLAFGGEHVTLNDLQALLGTADVTLIRRMAEALLERQPARALQEADAALRHGAEPSHVAEQLLSWFRDMLVASVGGRASLAQLVDSPQWPELAGQGRKAGYETLLAILQILDQALVRMRQSTHARLLLEIALVRISLLPNLMDLATLIDSLAPSTNVTAGRSTIRHPDTQDPTRTTIQGTGSTQEVEAASSSEPVQKETSPVAHRDDRPRGTSPVRPPGEPVDRSPPPQSGAPLSGAPEDYRETSSPNSAAETIPEISPDALWQQVADRLGGLVKSMMELAASVTWSGPDCLLIRFGAQSSAAAQACQRSDRKNQIEKTLAQLLGRPVSVRIEQLSSGEWAVSRPAPGPTPLETAARHPWVRRAIELFDAELMRVIPPDNNVRNGS